MALSTAVQPGSTFKMSVAVAALEQGLSPNYRILDKGFIKIGGIPLAIGYGTKAGGLWAIKT